MRCPACGNEETLSSLCSQCHTPLPAAEPEPRPASRGESRKPKTPSSPPSKEDKHRARPLHDLDLTIPELEVKAKTPPQSETKKDEDLSFKVSDRRHRFEDPQAEPGPDQSPRGAPPNPAEDPSTPPRVDFSSFVFSMGASALMALGEGPPIGSPGATGPAREIHLNQARELIDLLGVLEEKTKGNLTPAESELLRQTLYTLRLRFVDISKRK